MFNPQTEVLLHFLQSICRNQEIILFSASFCFFLLGFENKIIILRMKSYDGINHGKTKSARIQKRNVFSTDKNEM